MGRKSHFSTILAVLVLVIILSGSTGTFALAQVSGGEQTFNILADSSTTTSPQAPVPGGPGFVMIPSAAFQPSSSDTKYANFITLQTDITSPTTDYVAPVSLPHGARIKRLIYYYLDTDPAKVSVLSLWRYPVPGLNSEKLTEIQSVDTPAQEGSYVETSAVLNPIVNNQANIYIVRLLLPGSISANPLMACGVRIDYDFPVNIPVVMQ